MDDQQPAASSQQQPPDEIIISLNNNKTSLNIINVKSNCSPTIYVVFNLNNVKSN